MTTKNIILDIPHFSQIQWNASGIAEWERKICWLACIKMCIEYFNSESPDFTRLLSYKDTILTGLSFRDWEEKTYPFYIAWTWWFQYWLVEISKNFWLHWVIENVKMSEISQKIYDYLDENLAIIASVSLNFEKKEKKWWHLVVIKWIIYNPDWTFLKINDPMKKTWDFEISIDEFINAFSWNIIVLSDKNTEWFESNNPINFETIESSKTWKTYLHLHWNEELAYLETKKYVLENWWKLYSLWQNKERFIRYSIISEYWNKVFLRIDPNRVFTDRGLIQTITLRNSHLNFIDVPLSIEKWRYIRNYILSKLSEDDNLFIWVHNNRLMNINNYLWLTENIKLSSNFPENAFLMTNNENDYRLLSNEDINLVYVKEEDWSLWEYLWSINKHLITIETWFDDNDSFERLLKIVDRCM